MKRSWKTTLIGIGFGFVPVLNQVWEVSQSGQKVDWTQVLVGLGLISLGAFAKDHNVSGPGQPK